MLGSAAEATRADATPDSSVVRLPPVPPATALLKESVIARARTTSWIATPERSRASGSRNTKARTSCPGSCRTIAWRVETSSSGRTTRPASQVMVA